MVLLEFGEPKVTGVTGNWGRQLKSGGEHFACPAQGMPLIFAYDQKFETGAQPLTIPYDRAYFYGVWRRRDRELHGDDLTHDESAAHGCTHPILADLVGAAPECLRGPFTENCNLNTGIQPVTGEAAIAFISRDGSVLVSVQ